MPLPFILGGIAVAAGTAGVGTAIHGAKKMKDANDTMQSTNRRHERGMERLERQNQLTTKDMDNLGMLELEILHSFSEFSDVFEQIKNRPNFETYSKNGVELPKYEGEKIKDVSIGAGVLLGGLGGAGLGAAGGFAAAGATTAAVMALGTASTGTAIASLSGVAATNATLAALGGGAIAAGGGGMALGASVLGATTLGAGLLVGGIIFNFVGGKIEDQANEARKQMLKAEDTINAICIYLADLRSVAMEYYQTLSGTNCIYQKHLNGLKHIVTKLKHTNWNTFTIEEKKMTENTVLLVGLLYNMCKVEIVLKGSSDDKLNTINKPEVKKAINNANTIIADKQVKSNDNEKEYWIVEDNRSCKECGLSKDEIPVELLDYIGYKKYVELDNYIVWRDYNGAVSSYEYANKSVRFFENKNSFKMNVENQFKIYNKKTNEHSSFSLFSMSEGGTWYPFHNKIIYSYLHGLYVYDVDLRKNNCIYENLSYVWKNFSVNDDKVAFINASDEIVVLDLYNNRIVFEKKITTPLLLRSYDVCLWNGSLFYEENRKIMKYDFNNKTSVIVYEYIVTEKNSYLLDNERFMYINDMVCSKDGLYIIYWDKCAWKMKIIKIKPDNKVVHINCDIMANAGSDIWIFEENKSTTNKIFLAMYMYTEDKMYVLDMRNDKITILDAMFPEKIDRDRFNLVCSTLYWGEDKYEPSYKVELLKKWKTVELNPMCI